jgi:hypothetical protein
MKTGQTLNIAPDEKIGSFLFQMQQMIQQKNIDQFASV